MTEQPKYACTCLGSCKGKEGLAPQWYCVLEPPAEPQRGREDTRFPVEFELGGEAWCLEIDEAKALVSRVRAAIAKAERRGAARLCGWCGDEAPNGQFCSDACAEKHWSDEENVHGG